MNIYILGAGNMGLWMFSVLSKDHKVYIWDKDESKLNSLEDTAAILHYEELKNVSVDLLINAVDLGNIRNAFDHVLPYLPSACLISDIATIKGDLEVFYKDSGFPYVSIHPMFGPYFANLNALDGHNAIIIESSDEGGKQFFRKFFQALNVSAFEYSFKRHDQLMSVSLTLPFSASIAFAACAEDETVPGTTYARHREIARKLFLEDDFLLAEVLFNPGSIRQIERIVSKLEHLKHIIKDADFEEANLFFGKLRKSLKMV